MYSAEPLGVVDIAAQLKLENGFRFKQPLLLGLELVHPWHKGDAAFHGP